VLRRKVDVLRVILKKLLGGECLLSCHVLCAEM